jgi:hypothetical protein
VKAVVGATRESLAVVADTASRKKSEALKNPMRRSRGAARTDMPCHGGAPASLTRDA